MTLDQAINVLVTVTLVEMMVTIGLGVTTADLVKIFHDWRLIAQALVANYVVVPAATVGLLLLFRSPAMVAVGFLILAVCPGAPFGPPLTAVAKGNVPVAVGLMTILAGSSALLAPLLLALLVPMVASSEPVRIDASRLVAVLLTTQLLPLGVGLAIRFWKPALADRLQPSATLASKFLNLAAVGAILGTQYRQLAEIQPRGVVGMFALLAACWASGWLLGGTAPSTRKAMTLTAALRNVGVGLVIASSSFGGTSAVTAVLAFGLMGVIGSAVLALAWGRATPHAPQR